MRALLRVASGLFTILLLAGTAALSRWPVEAEDDRAFLRLSWRAEPIRVEECRTLTEEELEGVPAHMRRTEECTGEFVDYELRLEVDGVETALDTVSPSGIRRDRPVYILRDEPLEPGRHDVEVGFTALVPDDFVPDDQPVTLRWSGSMALESGEVGLVTLDDAGRALVRRNGGRRP